MKSFLYTIAVLFGALTVAQAAAEQKQPAAEEVIIEEVSAEAPAADAAEAKKEETK